MIFELSGFRRAMTLKPYSRAPITSWLRHTKWLYLAALSFFCLVYGFGFALTAPYLIVQFAIPIAILLAFTIWALPDTRVYPNRTMETLFFAFFIALVMWPNYLAIALPGMPWVTMLRLTGFPMAIAFLACLSTSGAFRNDLKRYLNAAPLLWKSLLSFALIQFLSIGLSDEIGFSTSKFFVAQVNWTAIFFVSCYVFSKPDRIQRWTFLLWVMAVWVALLSVWESRVQQVLWSGHVPSFLKIEDAESILAGSVRSATGAYRVKVTFSTPLGLGEFFGLALPFILHFAANAKTQVLRLAALATLPIAFYAVIHSNSRLGMVGSIQALMLYFAFWVFLRWRQNRNDILAPALVFATPFILAGGLAATLFVRRLRVMVWGGGASQASDAARDAQMDKGLPMILKAPWGHGIGKAADTLGHAGSHGKVTIDNYWLTIGLEYGVLGFIVYYGMLAYAIWLAASNAVKYSHVRDREYALFIPIAVALANFVVIKLVFSQQDNHPLIFMMLGMLVALIYQTRKLADTKEGY